MKDQRFKIEALLLLSKIEIEDLETEEEWDNWLDNESQKWESNVEASLSKMADETVDAILFELD